MWLCSLRHLSLFRHTCGCVEAWKRGVSAWQSRGERTRLTTTSKRWNRSFALSCLWLLAGWGGGLSPPGCLIKDTNRSKQLHHNLICHLASQNRPVHAEHKRLRADSSAHVVWNGKKEGRKGAQIKWWQRALMRWEAPHTHTHTYASVDTFNKCMPAFIVSVIMYTHLTGQIAPRWSQAAKHLMELRGPFQICN